MTTPLLLKKRETKLAEMRSAVEAEDYQQDAIDQLKAEVDALDQRIKTQRWLDAQAEERNCLLYTSPSPRD